MSPVPDQAQKTPLDTLVLLAAGIGLAIWCVVSFRAGGYYVQRDVFACQLSGYAALAYLAVSLCAGPLLRVASLAGLRVEREFSARLSRNAGIASALAAGLHTVISLMTYLKHDWWIVLTLPYLQWGVLALFVLLVLLVGSFKPLMSLVRWKIWKPLFRLSFLAAIFAFFHVIYAPFSPTILIVSLFANALLVSLFRWLPQRKQSKPTEPVVVLEAPIVDTSLRKKDPA
ncbi:putative sulfite oxidase subunit YedZ [Anatilimnocola aggregata]|uniref:Putative sulfite oxidase subunit YedZ n=1 Tax=Anatilimnocola aggregata TaxID=2528021 RepID=A0A517YDJ1_9BACT|nr:ferric reductase-like transmembrane domain-containing protein [Anatilimnocola aggregata]QDU28306.1 putative sulfite oxidase subunit YedZ [Anatilimnocola aggregata]